MENRSHAFAAGLFVLALGIALALAVWFFSGQRETTNTYVLETRGNVTGLNVQAQVRYRGIRAGKVESIETDPQDPRVILVRINLDSRYRLTKATTAQLGFQGITGLAYVQLEDRGESREYLGTDEDAPARIALKPTLFDSLGEKAGDLVGQLTQLSVRLNRLLDDKNVDNVARTLGNLADASAGLKEVPELLAAMRATLSDSNLQRIGNILAGLEKTAGAAAPLAADARETVKALTALSQRLDRFVETTGGEVSAGTLPQLNALMRELTANSRQLARVLETLEKTPQALIFGKGGNAPGPGEAGFVAPATTEK